jgi:precorrin-6Y C5,15-methyltransferase (decarboxylating)
MTPQPPVFVVGIGADGCGSLPSHAINRVAQAQVLVGGERHLAFFPQFQGRRIILGKGVDAALDEVAALALEHTVCVLASGDPMFFGIGGAVVRKLGAQRVEVIPQPSCVQWAFARAGLPWDDARFISLHGREREGFLSRLKRMAKVACLTDAVNGPRQIAALLEQHGETGWSAWLCENLGGAGERVRRFTIPELAAEEDIQPLNVLLLAREPAGWRPPPAISFLHEDAFAKRVPKKGLITKREVRLLSLAALGLRPDSVVWDVGAGSGSVAIEAALLAPEGRVYAIEVDPEGVQLCRDNARAHGVDNVRVVAGLAPAALEALEAPDAVFIGGSKGNLDAIVALALERLNGGGRLVINAITLDNVAEAYHALRNRKLEPDVMLVNISRGVPLAGYLRYEALNPVHIFAVAKPQGA